MSADVPEDHLVTPTQRAIDDLFRFLVEERTARLALETLLVEQEILTAEAIRDRSALARAIVEEQRVEQTHRIRLDEILARLRAFDGPPQ